MNPPEKTAKKYPACGSKLRQTENRLPFYRETMTLRLPQKKNDFSGKKLAGEEKYGILI